MMIKLKIVQQLNTKKVKMEKKLILEDFIEKVKKRKFQRSRIPSGSRRSSRNSDSLH